MKTTKPLMIGLLITSAGFLAVVAGQRPFDGKKLPIELNNLRTTFTAPDGKRASRSATELRSRIEQIAHHTNGKVGAAVMLIETGESTEYHGEQRFPMQSVYKFPIGMALLHEVDQGRISLEQKVRVEKRDLLPSPAHSPIREKHPTGGVELTVRELMRLMVSESDGTASDVLLRMAGGAASVTRYLHQFGVNGLVLATSEKTMYYDELAQYRNWATPIGAVKLLEKFYHGEGLSATSHALLMQLMTETETGPKRIKGLLPSTAVVAHKTGTSGTSKGLTRATNDIGLITLPDGRHLAIAVFVSDSTESLAVREVVIAKIAKTAWDWSIQFQ